MFFIILHKTRKSIAAQRLFEINQSTEVGKIYLGLYLLLLNLTPLHGNFKIILGILFITLFTIIINNSHF